MNARIFIIVMMLVADVSSDASADEKPLMDRPLIQLDVFVSAGGKGKFLTNLFNFLQTNNFTTLRRQDARLGHFSERLEIYRDDIRGVICEENDNTFHVYMYEFRINKGFVGSVAAKDELLSGMQKSIANISGSSLQITQPFSEVPSEGAPGERSVAPDKQLMIHIRYEDRDKFIENLKRFSNSHEYAMRVWYGDPLHNNIEFQIFRGNLWIDGVNPYGDINVGVFYIKKDEETILAASQFLYGLPSVVAMSPGSSIRTNK